MVDNREWLTMYRLLDYLRDIGKHFTISTMLEKDSVQQRLGSGLSFTEFSYQTLQATDFLHLYRDQGVEMQMGGADQWGNITAGISLIRRVTGNAAHGLSQPLLLTSDGRKMGKTEAGLGDARRRRSHRPTPSTSTGSTTDDADVATLLTRLTLMPRDQIEGILADQAADPGRRPGQRAFAFDLTARIHGREEAERQVRVAAAAFSSEPVTDPEVLDVLFREVAGYSLGRGGKRPGRARRRQRPVHVEG